MSQEKHVERRWVCAILAVALLLASPIRVLAAVSTCPVTAMPACGCDADCGAGVSAPSMEAVACDCCHTVPAQAPPRTAAPIGELQAAPAALVHVMPDGERNRPSIDDRRPTARASALLRRLYCVRLI